MLLAFAIVLFTIAVYMGLDAVTVRQKQVATSLARARRYGGEISPRESELTKDLTNRLLVPAAQKMANLALALPLTQNPDEIRRRLISAGLGHRLTPTAFLAIKGAGIVGSVVLGLALAGSGLLPVGNGLIFGIVGGVLAFIVPDFVLSRLVKTRRANMLVQLPEVLDLLCVSVEAGLGFDGALARITERSKGPLLEELSIVLHEMRIGESRIQALKNFAERLDMPGDDRIRPLDHPGRAARHVPRAHSPRPGRRQPQQAPDVGRGKGHEGTDQDALPDGDLHLPGNVHRHPRTGDAHADEALQGRGLTQPPGTPCARPPGGESI